MLHAALSCAVLCCAVLCRAVLCRVVLCCAVCCVALPSGIMPSVYCAAPPVLPCPALPCPALPCPALPCLGCDTADGFWHVPDAGQCIQLGLNDTTDCLCQHELKFLALDACPYAHRLLRWLVSCPTSWLGGWLVG